MFREKRWVKGPRGGGRGSAAPADVAEERLVERHRAVGDTDDADRGAGPGDRGGGVDGLLGADALEGGVDADAGSEVEDGLVGLVAAGVDDVGGAELASQALPVGVAAEGDDPLGAEPLRRQ